ncbi:MAG TPA: nucleotide sugar dehydrogenase [Polyangiaceae bacterium]
MNQKSELVVIGGCGHVGLPLAIVAAHSGRRTTICDINGEAVARVTKGEMPFWEEGAPALLAEALASGRLTATSEKACIKSADLVVVVVGTPIDEHLTPRMEVVFDVLEQYLPYFRNGQVVVLRSTVYPGVSAKVQAFFDQRGLDIAVAFCPERIAQGRAIQELGKLPQIISAFSERGLAAARALFEPFAKSVVVLEPLEAELAKLFSNTSRYIQFATANQFYTIATAHGADYHRIHQAMCQDYPRLSAMPGPGLAAGPCLFKDTMQLAAFSKHSFSLGLAAVWVNEGLPQFLVSELSRSCDLSRATVGILGMAFKAETDDIRDSLSYKLRKLLHLDAARTLCHDPYIEDPSFTPLEELLQESTALILATPHRAYRDLRIPKGKIVIDVWNFFPAPFVPHAGGEP